ncbi:DUF3298 domain-containing protein [Romboutsia sp.]|uniref:DUF3298 and DUF4163 domain-containing protein n=1 Tax=Romboutsia sp. TaxID=1965302 RepID=UPI003F38D006
MSKNKLDKLKDNYNKIEIPSDLENIVNRSLKNKKTFRYKKLSLSVASLGMVVLCINISPVFADTLEKVPVIGSIIKVVRISNYSVNDYGFDISVEVSKVEGLKNKELQNNINKEMEREGKELYKQYVKEMKELKKDNIEGKDLVKSWSETKTNNDKVLSLVVYTHHAQGSSNTTRKFYNIDKNKETALTLKGMFKDKDYISIINENIKNQMREQMKIDEGKVYWIDSEYPDMDFKTIKENQGFYINDKNELVICFDKYDVAPGCMGLVEFIIPKEVLKVNL